MFKELGKSILLYGVGSAIVKSISLFLVPIYARVFSPADYGRIDLITTIIAFATIISMMQLESAVSRYYFEEKNIQKRKEFISTALWTILFCSLFWGLIVSLFSKYLSLLLFKNTNYNIIIIIASLTIPFHNLFAFATVLIRFQKKPVLYIFIVSIHLLVTVGLSILFVVVQKMGLTGVFYGQLLGFILTAAIILINLRSFIVFSFRKNILTKLLRYSIPLVPAVGGVWVNSYANRFIMLGYLSIVDIGLYTIALKVASVFQLLGNAFRMAWLPFFFETLEKSANHREIYIRANKIITFVMFFLIAVFSLFSNEIVSIIAPQSYSKAGTLIGILSLSIGLNIIAQTIGMGPAIVKKTIYNTFIYFFSVMINIVFLFTFVPKIGLIGVPYSLVLSSLTLFIGSWIISERLYYIGFSKSFFTISFLITIAVLSISICPSLNLLEKCLFAFLPIFILCLLAKNQIRFALSDRSSS